MAKADVINYSALANDGNPFVQQPTNNRDIENVDSDDDDNDDTHHSGIMIHVVPDTSKSNICKKI